MKIEIETATPIHSFASWREAMASGYRIFVDADDVPLFITDRPGDYVFFDTDEEVARVISDADPFCVEYPITPFEGSVKLYNR